MPVGSHFQRGTDFTRYQTYAWGPADALPISRPAVSRHLRLLKEAGLVREEPVGTRRIYRLHDEGIEAVRAYLERVWGEAAARFTLVASNTTPGSGPGRR